MKMTFLLTVVAVPINTVVGVTAALQLSRSEFPGKTILIAMLDLPFSISPVVTGKPAKRCSPHPAYSVWPCKVDDNERQQPTY